MALSRKKLDRRIRQNVNPSLFSRLPPHEKSLFVGSEAKLMFHFLRSWFTLSSSIFESGRGSFGLVTGPEQTNSLDDSEFVCMHCISEEPLLPSYPVFSSVGT